MIRMFRFQDGIRLNKIVREGFEVASNSSGKMRSSEQSGAKSGALSVPNCQFDSNLAAVIEAWPKLPKSVQAAIVAIVQPEIRP
jgi:hypothetical protein